MKAAVYREYGSPDVVNVEDMPTPTPTESEVLVRIHAAAVASEDGTFRKGKPFIARSATGFTKPGKKVLGTQFAGVVASVGSKVTRFAEGDRVYGTADEGFGAHAEYICLPEDGAMVEMPSGLTFEEAAAVTGGVLTALPFLRDEGNVQPGQTVVVNGASGAVGNAAVQLAKHLGAEVIGVCSTGNFELVKSLGADRVIDYTAEDFTQATAAYDVVFDTVGKSSFPQCRKALKPGGVFLTTVISFAIFRHMLRTAMIGSKKAKIAFTGLRSASDKAEDLLLLGELIKAGNVRPVIDRTYPFAEIAEAHRYVDTGHKKGSVVVTMASSSGK